MLPTERLTSQLDQRKASKLSDLICDAVDEYCVARDMPKVMSRKRGQGSNDEEATQDKEGGATDPKRQCTQIGTMSTEQVEQQPSLSPFFGC